MADIDVKIQTDLENFFKECRDVKETTVKDSTDRRELQQEHVRKVAKELRHYLYCLGHELTKDDLSRIMQFVNKQVEHLVHQGDTHAKIVSTIVIDELIEIDEEDNTTKVTRANFLRLLLNGSDTNITNMASNTLGHLILNGGTIANDSFGFYMNIALEWLDMEKLSNESRRHTAIVVLRELASNAPTLFFSYPDLKAVLFPILHCVRDAKKEIRNDAVTALRAFLNVIGKKDRSAVIWFDLIYDDTQNFIHNDDVQKKALSDHLVHGSLLVLGELFRNAGEFMKDKIRFSKSCDFLFSHLQNKNSIIARTVMGLCPVIAGFNFEDFSQNGYFNRCMDYIISKIKFRDERDQVFAALGEMSVHVNGHMAPWMSSIISNIKDFLETKLTKKASAEERTREIVFNCIGMLARSKGIAKILEANLSVEPMFNHGLSIALVDALYEVGSACPSLMPKIQILLLDHISMVLAGVHYNPSSPSMPLRPMKYDNENLVRLCLKTLGSFDFSVQITDNATKLPSDYHMIGSHLANVFLGDIALSFLDNEVVGIREEAARTCSYLSALTMEGQHKKSPILPIVLEKLILVAITDREVGIRLSVLESFSERFNELLATDENMSILTKALNDEKPEIRELAVAIIGRLINYNPKKTIGPLRKKLIQVLSELELSHTHQKQEESARLLTKLIMHAPMLMKPYIKSVLASLESHLHQASPVVAANILAALGLLCQLGGRELLPFVEKIQPTLMKHLHQPSVSHRLEALRTLGSLCQSSGYVIAPYKKNSQLLDVLLNFLKTERLPAMRREVIKVLGILGALDPYQHKLTQSGTIEVETAPETQMFGESLIVKLGPSHPHYYPTVACNALVTILNDETHSSMYRTIVKRVEFMVNETDFAPFLPLIIPTFLSKMRFSEPSFRIVICQTLSHIVEIVKENIIDYLNDMMDIIVECWEVDGMLTSLLELTEKLSDAVEDFKCSLSKIMPFILKVLSSDTSDKRTATGLILNSLQTYGSYVDGYLHLLISPTVNIIETSSIIDLRVQAAETLCSFLNGMDCSEYALSIVHPVVRSLQGSSNIRLRNSLINVLIALVYTLGPDYAVFVPMVAKVLSGINAASSEYSRIVGCILHNQPLKREISERKLKTNKPENTENNQPQKKYFVEQDKLEKFYNSAQPTTKDDWLDWIRRFNGELLQQSPSAALRACSFLPKNYLLNTYPAIASELFNAGFLSCWTELYENSQDRLVRTIQAALSAKHIPSEITHTLLNLAEFMEHDDKKLPLEIEQLGDYAQKCQAYAKALHYNELNFLAQPSEKSIENLIIVNNHLKLPEAATGVLVYTTKHYKNMVTEQYSWFEKLEKYSEALEVYEEQAKRGETDWKLTLGRMRCLHALCKWDELHTLSQAKWQTGNENTRRVIAPMGAAAAWGLGQWEYMDEYISVMRKNNVDCAFFRSVLSLHDNNFRLAQKYIDQTRDLLDPVLTAALAGESYTRGYRAVVRAQLVSELEEILQYKQSDPVKQGAIRDMWVDRLNGCQKNVEIWQRILKVRSLVVSPRHNEEMLLKFSTLCRKANFITVALSTLTGLLGFDPAVTNEKLPLDLPRTSYAYLKHMWHQSSLNDDNEARQKYFEQLLQFSVDLAETCTGTISNDMRKILARVSIRLGQWASVLIDSMTENLLNEVLQHFKNATFFDNNWYKAWHNWALMNFQAVNFYRKKADSESSEEMKCHLNDLISHHCSVSISGFFQSISLFQGNSLQDTLRLLTLWFKYGSVSNVNTAVNDGIKVVPIHTWLQVIPQLIARIHTRIASVRQLIHNLLLEIGYVHPQALIYPLTVASKSQSIQRRQAALKITDKVRRQNSELVEQANLVSSELLRAAILWDEMWHEGIEEASRDWFYERYPVMLSTLEHLHASIEKGPETFRELSFHQSYGRYLKLAHEWLQIYKETNNLDDLHEAWSFYHDVFTRISMQLPKMNAIELQYVAPKLLESRDYVLAVPGTYKSSSTVVKIASFATTLKVIASKQRPRKMMMYGSDGKTYSYLLKGHEDLRQDERCMQLFGLVNNLLSSDPETFRRQLKIQRFSVIPLSPKSGLLGWVPHCDTIYVLIKEYRRLRKLNVEEEETIIKSITENYAKLTVPQKLEVFQHALDKTKAQDLYNVLWLKSANSEAWLERRTTYTRSLAVMSMVGYILGLGDRHMSNLMLDRVSGRIVHIDFGDCFETAIDREKFPERVPFRLTRMLANAMEVGGIEGNYKLTCINTMRVMRDNRDSLMAVLEAFVYDPLINWRLMEVTTTQPNPEVAEMAESLYRVRTKQRSEEQLVTDVVDQQPEVLNERAVAVIARVQAKLTGKEFATTNTLLVEQQVEKLITQATSNENLCQHYLPWSAFW